MPPWAEGASGPQRAAWESGLDELPAGPSGRVAASNFLPLIAGIPSRRRARRMLDTLRNPARFWGDWVVPTIARDIAVSSRKRRGIGVPGRVPADEEAGNLEI